MDFILANNTFSSCDEMLEWLQSDAGGNLCVRRFEAESYVIIHYKKGVSNMDLPHVRRIRSVIWDTQDRAHNVGHNVVGKQVCCAPGSAIELEPVEEYTGMVQDVEEFVDGTMINMFWDTYTSRWRLATRTCLDAANSFNGTRSFSELFWETFELHGLNLETDFKLGCFYSWVLQHPEERNVVSTGSPVLKLCYTNDWDHSLPPSLLPQKFEGLLTLEDIYDILAKQESLYGHNFKGVLFYDEKTLQRYKVCSPTYKRAKGLRLNQAKLPYVWLSHMSGGTLEEYLEFFPEEKERAGEVVECYRGEVLRLQEASTDPHTKSKGIRNLLYEANQMGISNMEEFMERQPTARKLWLINYGVC